MTLEECFIKRRQLSQEIVGSFLREISILVMRDDVPKIYLLELIRLIGSVICLLICDRNTARCQECSNKTMKDME